MAGRADRAATDFRHAVALDANAVSPRLNLAVSLLQSGQEAEGIQQLQAVVRLDPQQPLANLNLGLYYAHQGECGKVVEAAERLGASLTATVRRSAPLRVAMVHCLLRAGDGARAQTLLPSARENVPAAVHFALASELAGAAQYRLALEQLQAIPAAESDAAVHFNRGMMESHLHQYRRARREYFAAIDGNPNEAMAYFRVGVDYEAASDRPRAIPWLMKAHAMAPDDPEVTAALAEALIQSNYFDSAQKILDAFPDTSASALPVLARADLLLAKKQYAQASDQYARALQLNPELVAAAVGHARVLAELGQADAARKEMEASLRAHSGDLLVQAELGRLELAAHDLQPAVLHLRAAWQARPHDVQLSIRYARALRLGGHPAAALAVLRALPDAADNPKYHFERSQVYRALHQGAGVRAELAQMRRISQRKQEDLHFVPPATYIH